MNEIVPGSFARTSWRARVTGTLLLCLLAGGQARAQTAAGPDADEPSRSRVQLAPFAGLQFGGSVFSSGRKGSIDAGLGYGGTLDVRIADSWSLEALYSRQGTELPGSFDATVERYLLGLMEEHDHGRTKFFGVALLGGTRFVPGPPGYRSSAVFTIGLGLGVKHRLSDRFGLRADARGFYAITESGGGLFCSGGCLFTFGGSGLVQGDVAAGVFFSF